MFIDQNYISFAFHKRVSSVKEFLEVILEDETERHEFGCCFLKSVKIEVERQLSSVLLARLDDKNLYGCDKISKEVLDNV